VRFTWDPVKAAMNVRKHGLSFAEASTCFADPLALYLDHPSDPSRAVLIGTSESGRLLYTVHVQFDADVVRIISARRATPHERSAYEEGD
jgi:hypothetical protein